MTKVEAQQIANEIGVLEFHDIEVSKYCDEYVVRIFPKEPQYYGMYVPPKVCEVCSKHYKGVIVQKSGGGTDNVKAIIM
jgi:hypothetical protein